MVDFFLKSKIKGNLKKIKATSHKGDYLHVIAALIEKDNAKKTILIEEFNKITKIPVILNTSFNDAGEPLVENHIDAIISFLKTNS